MNGVVLPINIASRIVVFHKRYDRQIQKDIQKEQEKGLPILRPVVTL
jgi:hypothetical protein